MKRYNYFYGPVPITKTAFISSVPDDWENDTDEYGEYYYGYYRAVRVDDEGYDDGDNQPIV